MSEYIPRAESQPGSYIVDDTLREFDATLRSLIVRNRWAYVSKGGDIDKSREYVAVGDPDTIIEEYLYREFNLDLEATKRMMESFHQRLIVPTDIEFEMDPVQSLNAMRTAIITGIMPLAIHEKNTAAFAEWLPDALAVAIPKDGEHSRRCIEVRNGCLHIHCPAKTLAYIIKRYAELEDFNEFGYVRDHEAMRDKVHALFIASHQRGLLSDEDLKLLNDEMWQHYTEAFPEVPKDSNNQ